MTKIPETEINIDVYIDILISWKKEISKDTFLYIYNKARNDLPEVFSPFENYREKLHTIKKYIDEYRENHNDDDETFTTDTAPAISMFGEGEVVYMEKEE